MSLRKQRVIVSAGALFVLVAALLPGIVYMGHWGSARSKHEHPEEARAAEHENHCHTGLANCSGGLGMVGTWWVGEDPDAAEPATSLTMLITDHDATFRSAHAARIFQPPRIA